MLILLFHSTNTRFYFIFIDWEIGMDDVFNEKGEHCDKIRIHATSGIPSRHCNLQAISFCRIEFDDKRSSNE